MLQDKENKLMIIHDPISPSSRSSHNQDVCQYSHACAIKSYSRVLYSKSYGETDGTSKFLRKIFDGLKIFHSSVRTGIKASVLQQRYKVVVFNPNEDSLSFITLLIIRKLLGQEWRLISRFICTRDRRLADARPDSVRQFQNLIKFITSPNDKFSAETIEYASHLSELFNLRVTHVPYPPIDLDTGYKSTLSGKFIVVVPGAARIDKGFAELPNLINKLHHLDIEVEFLIQSAQKEWPGYGEVLEELKKLPNVKILPSYIPTDRLSEVLRESNAVLLPYSQTVYAFRGSAFARRGMYLGKTILASEGTSMANDAELWGFSAPVDVANLLISASENSLENYYKGRALAKNAEQIWDLALQ